MRNFKNIKAWQYADNLAVRVYKETRVFPKQELYGLVSQLRRAAVSVPNNIAEGSARQYKKEYLNFLYIARGSLSEISYLAHLSRRLNYFSEKCYKELDLLIQETGKVLHGLMLSVKKELK